MPVSVSTVELTFDGIPPLPNRTRGSHWSRLYKEGEVWKQTAYYLAKSAYHGPPLARAHLHYHFSVGSNRRIDPDNLISSIKHLQDGIREAMLVDDNIDAISVEFSFDRAKPKGIRLTISSLPSYSQMSEQDSPGASS